MREYRYQATDASIEVLRHLKSPWQSATLHARALTVRTADAHIRISVEQETVETILEAQRLRADVVPAADDTDPRDAGRDVWVTDLALGRNDVVLFTGETWVDAPVPAAGDAGDAGDANGATAPQVLQFSGRAGQRPPSASLVCTTTDAIVIAASSGEGVLVRIGARPLSIDVVHDRAAIARFLVQRGYTAG